MSLNPIKSYTGVKTTGIFCSLNCPAAPPLKKNTIRLRGLNEAKAKGFRPCKVCTPEYHFIDSIVSQSTREVTIRTARNFSFKQLLAFLRYFPNELLFSVQNDTIYRLYSIGQDLELVSISQEDRNMKIKFHGKSVKKAERLMITDFIWRWFDLERDLTPFYKIAKEDKLLGSLSRDFKGLRVVRIADLFEALCWAIIGQQVNLTFAFAVKDKFIRRYGNSQKYDKSIFYTFPKPEKVTDLSIRELKEIQLSERKAEYILEVANQMVHNGLSVENLEGQSYQQIYDNLIKIRGIGPWTADYVLMKTFGFSNAFPTGDAGLQNAVKTLKKMKKKPTETQLHRLAKPWRGWEAYATFYLWRSLY